MANKVLAILGRPNVGKSTLFNRLVGSRKSIVSPVEGVTRDRVYSTFDWVGRDFDIIDTGGFLPKEKDIMNKHIQQQARIAIKEADLIILLVDGKDEITSSDRILADMVIRSQKKSILVVNKIDSLDQVEQVNNFFQLGLGDPIPISAVHGRSVGDMLDVVVQKIPDADKQIDIKKSDVDLALIGMPNVGKTSLYNIISSNNFRVGGQGWAGVTVFGHLGDGWAKSGPTWNVHDFAVTNIYSDGSVPLSPEPPWQLYNVYRARPTEDASAIDLKAEIVDICYAGCDPESIVRVAGQPINVGPSSVRANIPLSLYRKDGNAYTFLASALTTDRIDAGTKGVSLEFETTFARIDGAGSLVIRADDWGNGFGTIEECDEWNNGIEYTELSCIPTPE